MKKDFLDQYYTKEDVSLKCCYTLENKLNKYIDFAKVKIVEPSAGTGSFVNSAKKVFGDDSDIIAYDKDPKADFIIKEDFLKLTLEFKKNVITIGNPPFGKRSNLAISFFNKVSEFSEVIAFIVPLQFNKYSVQNRLNKDFKLIFSENLKEDSFIHKNKSYKIRCCFQIWTKIDTTYENLRILKAPETSHPDFEMYQHNNTKETLKFFNKDTYKWDFAVPRQGFYDYSLKINDPKELKKNIQYIFFKAKNQKVKNRLLKIDFNELSKKNTTIPGFGKADLVEYYKEMFENE